MFFLETFLVWNFGPTYAVLHWPKILWIDFGILIRIEIVSFFLLNDSIFKYLCKAVEGRQCQNIWLSLKILSHMAFFCEWTSLVQLHLLFDLIVLSFSLNLVPLYTLFIIVKKHIYCNFNISPTINLAERSILTKRLNKSRIHWNDQSSQVINDNYGAVHSARVRGRRSLCVRRRVRWSRRKLRLPMLLVILFVM